MRARISPKQGAYLVMIIAFSAAAVVWVFFPLAIPFVEGYWRDLGKPSIGNRTLYPIILALIGFALAAKRY